MRYSRVEILRFFSRLINFFFYFLFKTDILKCQCYIYMCVDSVVYFTDRTPPSSFSYCVHFYIRSHCIENKRHSVILAIVTVSAFPSPPLFFLSSTFVSRIKKDKKKKGRCLCHIDFSSSFSFLLLLFFSFRFDR